MVEKEATGVFREVLTTVELTNIGQDLVLVLVLLTICFRPQGDIGVSGELIHID